MKNKELQFSNEARQNLLEGINLVADAVASTLGPRGRIVAIDNGSEIITTKDGVTVARNIQLADKNKNIGAKLVQEVSKQTNDVAGDGTTTATVLAQAIVNHGMKKLSDGADAQAIKRGLETTLETLTEALNSLAKPVTDVEAIASISANDSEIGKLIGNIIDKLGKKAAMVVEPSQTSKTEVSIVEGMQLDGGWQSMHMVTDKSTMKAEYDNIPVLIVDGKPTIHQLLPLLQEMAQSQGTKKELVIIAEQLDDIALNTFVQNTLTGTFKILAVRPPEYGRFRTDCLSDLALLTGGKVVNSEVPMEEISVDCLGHIDRIVAEEKQYTITSTKGDKTAIAKRVEDVETLRDNVKSKLDKEKLSARIAKLTSGVGVIKVGASTESDAKEKEHRVEDAVNATRAAIAEGVVEGGGITPLRLQKFIQAPLEDEEEDIGRQILYKALEAPFRKIVENAGKNAELILSGIQNNGYNAKTLEYVKDMHKEGIVDPKKVTRLALESSVSIAKTVLTTEVVITEEQDEE